MQIGIGTSKGIGIGTALVLKQRDVEVKVTKITDTVAEKARFEKARDFLVERTRKMTADMTDKLGKTAEILRNQIVLAGDQELVSGVESLIDTENLCAEAAVDETCNLFIKIFQGMDDMDMAQRAVDVEDLKNRLIRILMNIEEVDLSEIPPDTVIVAEEIVPSMTALMNTDHIVGIVAEKGGDTSHAAILARAMELPAVLSVKNAVSLIKNGDSVIVDGDYGEIFINPIQKTVEIYQRKQAQFVEKMNELKKFVGRRTLTKEGHEVELVANVGGVRDVAKAMEAGAEGIGLFRTEFLFMNVTKLPGEDEQFEVYRNAAIMSRGKPVIIRTIDIGGDKDVPYLGLTKETNPFLGYRGIRYCLDRCDIFMTQLTAILRASAYGDIRIMLPLITSLNEVVAVKKYIDLAKRKLDEEEIEYNKEIKLGVMIETPAASLIADILAKEVDFFSIGTNDLIQYTVAVDRGNENVSYLYTPFHPSVLRSIRHIIACAKAEHIPVGMCGEAAGNPYMVPLLLAFGLEEFSVTPSNVLETRKNIASWTLREAQEVTDKVMGLWTHREIMNYLDEVIDHHNNAKTDKSAKIK